MNSKITTKSPTPRSMADALGVMAGMASQIDYSEEGPVLFSKLPLSLRDMAKRIGPKFSGSRPN